MKILVTGGSGLAGSHIVQYLEQFGHTVFAPTRQELDITKALETDRVFSQFRPEAVINCAAYVNADKAEEEPQLASAVNTFGTNIIAMACKCRQIKLIHLSTNFVYNDHDMSSKTGFLIMYENESDEQTRVPISTYAKTKHAGDLIVLNAAKENIVLRTTSIYGLEGGNYVSSIINKLRSGKSVTLDPTRVISPTSAYSLAETVASLLLDKQCSNLKGIVHYSNGGYTTWAEFGRHAAKLLGVPQKRVVKYDPPYKANRPKVLLSMNKLMDVSYPIVTWTNALKEVILIDQAS